ncbi:MAG: hypothetical protein IJ955_06920 [Oscillospiraceae bacterium]|nr:hypothetical protein [Oscillospiraceae bacterium]
MATESTYLWDWEKIAQTGGEMPDRLPLVDQLAFTTMRNIYTAYHQKRITREVAVAEKKRVRRSYEQMRDKVTFESQLAKKQADLFVAVEQHSSAYRKDRTLENADRLMQTIYGFLSR